MTRKVPGHVHDFELTKVSSAAVTYHLRPSPKARDGLAYHIGGWALATVNDATGELAIQSDWGTWSHRWNINHLGERGSEGRNCTLTEFLGERDDGHCDYLADKLSSREERNVFSSERTVQELQRLLCENRLEQGRLLIENYEDEEDAPDVGTDDPPRWCMERRKVRPSHSFRDEEWPLTKATARALFDALDGIKHTDDARDFVDSFYRIDGHEWIGAGIEFECLRYEPASSYFQLLHGILPALVRACAARPALTTDTPP